MSAEANGVIETFAVQVGDQVRHGQLLASLNCEEHNINVESATADLKAAKSKRTFASTQLASARKLSSVKGIAKEQVDERRSEFAVASAEIDRAQAAFRNAERLVNNCRIKSPFSGIVTERLASVGDYATVGTPIVRLVDTDNIEISANVQEQDLRGLEEAEELVFFDRQNHFPAKIRTTLPVMDSRLRSFEVRLTFRQKKPAPGTTGRLQWKSPWPHISSEYLVSRGSEQLGLFILTERRVARFVSIDEAKQGRPVRVELPAITPVILDGRYVVTEGDPVEVTTSDVTPSGNL